MATSASMRVWYPEFIDSYSPLKCDFSDAVTVKFLAAGHDYPHGFVWLRFHPATVEWARALAAVFYHHDYPFREKWGGTLNCRKITGGNNTSLHAHGVALDINPSKNGYRRTFLGGLIQWGKQTDMSREMVRDAEAIRTVGGHRVTEWGGRWVNIKDPMHYQCSKCRRDQLERGIDYATVQGWYDYAVWADLLEPEEEDLPLLPMKQGDGYDGPRESKKSDVAYLQSLLNEAYNARLQEDGKYGEATTDAIAQHVPGAQPSQPGKDDKGSFITGKMFENLTKDHTKKLIAKYAEGGLTLEEASLHFAQRDHPHSGTVVID